MAEKIKIKSSAKDTKDSFAKYAPKSSNLNSEEVVITYYLDIIFLDVVETKQHFNLKRLSSLTSSQIDKTPAQFLKRKAPKEGRKRNKGQGAKLMKPRQTLKKESTQGRERK